MTSPTAVEGYLAALARQDWAALGACVTDDVRRVGPYNDVFEGRDAYVGFLAKPLASLPGYELRVSRLIVAPETVVAELSETIDGPQGRMRTDEAVVFDLAPDGRIRRVGVFLRRSVDVGGG
jgi:predicted ester cyclase